MTSSNNRAFVQRRARKAFCYRLTGEAGWGTNIDRSENGAFARCQEATVSLYTC